MNIIKECMMIQEGYNRVCRRFDKWVYEFLRARTLVEVHEMDWKCG